MGREIEAEFVGEYWNQVIGDYIEGNFYELVEDDYGNDRMKTIK